MKNAEANKNDVVLYAFMPYLLDNRELQKKPLLIKFKSLYNIYVNLKKQKEKNIDYD